MSEFLSLREENKDRAFRIYRHTRRLQQICDELKISYGTAFEWRRKENWDERLLTEQCALPAILDDTKDLIPKLTEDEIKQRIEEEQEQLDSLEMRVIGTVIIDDMRPRNWKDVIATLRFVAERRDILQDKIARVALGARQTVTQKVETENADGSISTITIEQQVYARTLANLISAEKQDLSTLSRILETSPVPSAHIPLHVQEAADEAEITLCKPAVEEAA